jgi:hypothetical protein
MDARIHAYTLPRESQNSRVKDLLDLALPIGSGGLDKKRTLEALRLMFDWRRTHDLPSDLAAPPMNWQIPFQALAKECGLSDDIGAVFAAVRRFPQELSVIRDA